MLILPASSLILADAESTTNLQTCDFGDPNNPNDGETLEQCQRRILGEAGGGPAGYGANTNITESTLAEKVGQVIGMVLSVFGVVFFCLVVYSGIQWMTAGGNEEKVTHARERIIRAAIGLGIVMMAYALTSFIVSRLQPTAGVTPARTPAQECTAENFETACIPICDELNQRYGLNRHPGGCSEGMCYCSQ